jgi:hypothetical protein
MNNEKRVTTMTEADEIRELRKWLREDSVRTSEMVAELRKKIDYCDLRNQQAHQKLGERISAINTDSKVNDSKIVGLAGLVSIIVSGIIFAAFQVFAGG